MFLSLLSQQHSSDCASHSPLHWFLPISFTVVPTQLLSAQGPDQVSRIFSPFDQRVGYPHRLLNHKAWLYKQTGLGTLHFSLVLQYLSFSPTVHISQLLWGSSIELIPDKTRRHRQTSKEIWKPQPHPAAKLCQTEPITIGFGVKLLQFWKMWETAPTDAPELQEESKAQLEKHPDAGLSTHCLTWIIE